MTLDDELEDLLLRWDAIRAEGGSITLEELCRDHPARIDEVRRLTRVIAGVDDWLDPEKVGDAGAIAPATEILPEDVETGARYRSVRLQARGGLGEVFVAWDEELRREVALKLIQRPYDRDAHLRERFLREAEITARLGHPGVVPIFGVGRTRDGRPCYAMRYIKGETLRAAIVRFHSPETPARDPRARTLAFRALLSRLVDACQAIGYAHSRGVIHRDLKPDNVMLGPFQETLVVDWGLARRGKEPANEPPSSPTATSADDADDSLTRFGSTLGTPAYMSPEQAEGRWDAVGPASDVYSLGVTLYYLLTCRPAFQESSRQELLERVRRGEFSRPRAVKPDVPRALEAICLKAMALRPEDRYDGAVALATDIERWLADEPVTAWREPALTRMGRWVRRNRTLVTSVGALAATALIALSISTALLGRERLNTKRALNEARASDRRARATAADVQTSFGLAASERMEPAEAALWFAVAAETSGTDLDRARANRIRSWHWRRLAPRPIALIPFRRPPRGVPSVNLERVLMIQGGNRYLISVSREGLCLAHDLLRDQPVTLPVDPWRVTSIAWGGTSSGRLAIGRDTGGVDVVQLDRGAIVDRLSTSGRINALEFDREGRRLAIGGNAARVRDLDRHEWTTPELSGREPLLHIAFNDTADRLAFSTVHGAVYVHDVSSKKASRLFATEPNRSMARRGIKEPRRLVFVDAGRGLLIVTNDREISWREVSTGTEVRRLQPQLNVIYNLLLSPDRKTLVAIGLRGVHLFDATTGRFLRQFGDMGVETAAFTPDGEHLLISTGHYLAESLAFPSCEREGWSLRQQDLATRLTVSTDGSTFAIAQSDALVRAWRLPVGPPDDRVIELPTRSPGLASSLDARYVMPVGKDLSAGPSSTHVFDLESQSAGPELKVEGVLHGGAFAPDARQVVTLSSPAGVVPPGSSELEYPIGSARGSVQFWNRWTGVPQHPRIETPTEPIAVSYSPDGRWVAVLCVFGELLWIDPRDGRVVHRYIPTGRRFQPGTPTNELLRFSPDGKVLLAWGAGTPELLDPGGGIHQPALNSGTRPLPFAVYDARFSRDGRYLATGGGSKTSCLWELATGRELARFTRPDWVFQVGFNADGSRLITAGRDGNAQIDEWRTRRAVGPPLSHPAEVHDARFLGDGPRVLTRTVDGLIQLWESATGRPLAPPRRIAGTWESQLVVAPNGRRAAIVSNTNPFSLHVLDLADWTVDDDPEIRTNLARPFAELVAGQKIVGGSVVVNLTSLEWVAHWRSLHNSNGDRSTAP